MEEKEEKMWWKELGTLGELLLAYAVKRHGTNCWESIAHELRKRLKYPFSSHFCRLKYLDLLRRFHNLPVADELRKLRVQELKQQLLRHTNAIAALQSKVKRLKEELTEKEETDPRDEPNKVFDSVENRSYNESNESNQNNKGDGDGDGDGEEREEKGEIASEEDRSGLRREKMNTNREGSSRMKRRRTSRGDELLLEGGANKRIDLKSQPLIKLLDTLRSHKHGSPFITRLPSQESEKYQRLVRQHMDLDRVEYRFHKGDYNDCHSKFYRDLLLIFTNAVIFYRKSSAEHMAARELRKLVIDEISLRTRQPNNNDAQPTKFNPEMKQLDPVVKKPRSSSTSSMVAYRRRSSALSNSMQSNKKDDSIHSNGVVTRSKEKDDSKKIITKDSCLSKRGGLNAISDNVNVDDNKEEDEGRLESEGVEAMEMTRKKKASMEHKEKGMSTRFNKQGVANFLKRINQNSPSNQEEKRTKVIKKVIDDEDDEDKEEEEEERRRKTRKDRNNNGDSKGKRMKGGGNANANGDETKVKKASGNKKMLKAKGGRPSLRSDADETSRRWRPTSRR